MEKDHSAAASQFLKDRDRARWHDETLWFVREKRDRAAWKVNDWEELRNYASQIKSHTLSRLDEYLIEFEKNAKANGIIVHWASDAAEHNRIVHGLLKDH